MRSLKLDCEFGGLIAWDSFFHLPPRHQRRMFPIFRDHAERGASLLFTSGPAFGEAIWPAAGFMDTEIRWSSETGECECRDGSSAANTSLKR